MGEGLLVHLSQSKFRLEENVRCAAFRLFREVKHHMESSRPAFESGNEDDFIKFWIVSIIYCALKISSGTGSLDGKRITLTKLLSSVNSPPVLDFFKELSCFLQKAEPVLKTFYKDGFDRFQEHIKQLQASCVYLTVLYDNYEKNFFKFFSPSEKLLKAVTGTNASGVTEKSLYLRFGWMLFLSLRMRFPGQFVDLMTCANGLIAIFVIMVIHMPAYLRKAPLEDRSTYAICSSKGVNVISSLCHLYDACEEDVEVMVQKVHSTVRWLIEADPNCRLVNELKERAGIDTVGLVYFQGLMEENSITLLTDILDEKYTEVYLRQGEIDERFFLPDSRCSVDSPADTSSSAKRKYDTIFSPSKALDSKTQTLAEYSPPSSSAQGTSHQMPPPTPLSVSMSLAKWLHSVISPLSPEPSPSLISYFRSCNPNIAKDISYRANVLLECVFPSEAIRGAQEGDVKPISQRRLEALKLYYRVLGAMCEAEAQRLKNNNLSDLISNERFHRCMLACSAEVVLATYMTASMAFPAVLTRMGITAFDLNKVIESFVRHEETLPKELKRHLNSIEERLLEMLVWAKGSSLYNSLIIAKPHLKAEIYQLGLLAEPMPSLECMKSQLKCTMEFPETAMGNALDKFCDLLLPSTKRNVDDFSCSTISSPIEERSPVILASTPTKAPLQPPLHSTFASPQKQTTAGGESSAEIVLSVFFQKVLKLASIRIKLLCEILKQPNHLVEDTYRLFGHLLHQETHLFFSRHIDQIILCSLFGICKVEKINMTFKEIVENYKQFPQHKPYVFRAVLLDSRMGGRAKGDIIQFYNDIFIPSAKSYLIQLSTQLVSSGGNGGSEEGLPIPSHFRSLHDASPKKVSSGHNVYVSPLKTSKVLSPHSRRLYACFGESTHSYQSPSKDLTDINKRINYRRMGRLDVGDVELVKDSVIAEELLRHKHVSGE